MSSNETLIASAASDAIDIQPAPEEAGYTYQRADGTIERALNAEDAIARCPVLGKLAIEAPEQANVLLELAAAGKEKMAQEKAKQPEPQEPKRSEINKPEKAVKHDEREQPARVESFAKSVMVQPEKQGLSATFEQAIRQQELAPTKPEVTRNVIETSKEGSASTTVKVEPRQIPTELHTRQIADIAQEQTTLTHVHTADMQARELTLKEDVSAKTNVRLTPVAEYIPDQMRTRLAIDDVLSEITTTQVSTDTVERFSAISESRSSVMDVIEAYEKEMSEDEPINLELDDLSETPSLVEFQEPLVLSWETELSKDPLELYDDFVEALQVFAELSIEPLATEQDEQLILVDADEVAVFEQELQPTPPIIAIVAEKLAELELPEKELIAPILQGIVEIVNEIELLEDQATEPEAIEIIEIKLAELCITLFEAIGIEYDEQDIEQFIQTVLRPEFRPPQPAELELLDLENIGTREAKINPKSLAASLTNVEHKLERLLGTFVLFCLSATAQSA